MKKFIVVILCILGFSANAQKVTLDPVISPALFRYNDQITVTYDVTGTSLANLSAAYIWVWIPNKNINAKYNINPATAAADAAKFVKNVSGATTTFSITFKPSDFFATSISAETKLGMLIKGVDWSNGQSTDYIADIWDGSFQVKLTAPTEQPLFVNNADEIVIEAETPIAANYSLYINEVLVDTKNSLTNYSYTHTVTETTGFSTIRLEAVNGANADDISFQYIISGNSASAPRPNGIIAGINYSSVDDTKVTLCLWAPGKSSVYVRGDFTDWQILPEKLMKKDGEYFWIEVSGLTQGVEYGFQYLIDETIYVADPYADKILDPDDQYIPSAVYPGLKTFPQEALNDQWYFNRVAIFQTGQTPYDWQVENFEKPIKENLVIYELLLRDFFADGQRSYQNLIDTISYFKGLGVSAVELMPIMEFNGNDSWGYNPEFMFAPDKYFGSKNKLKEFIDKCHQEGIAVIFDIAMNHQNLANPYVMMDFNFTPTVMKPTASNKWFNVNATHPYSVFYDLNHESSYTKAYLDTVNYYWLNEYKVDGYRFDLSKGFTQNARCGASTSNEACIGQRDDSRIAILKRMSDAIWSHSPDAYVILEHFADNSEEKELAEYRAAEGKGMMLWGNLNYAYSQNSMGFATSSDISWISHATRGWSTPHVVGYMESHDEERLMYRNLQFGNTLGGYSVKTLATALERIQAASTIFYTIPGPKMLWQFGELGYDYSINHCPDGSNNSDCRVSAKPVAWEYQDDYNRNKLYKHIRNLIHLRNSYPVFTSGTTTFEGMSTLTKQLTIKSNPYTATPATANEMNVVVVVNFDVSSKNITTNFPHTGTWYDLYDGGKPISVTGASQVITFKAGEYRILTDVYLPEESLVTGTESEYTRSAEVYPNPTSGKFEIDLRNTKIKQLSIINTQGVEQNFTQQNGIVDISNLPSGLYILKISDIQNKRSIKKVVKR